MSSALLGPSKRRKTRVCRDPTPSGTISDSGTGQAVPFADDSTEEDEEDTHFNVLYSIVVSLTTTLDKSRHDLRKFSDGRTHFALEWRKISFVSLVRVKHCFVLSLYPLYLSFLKFCNYSL